LRSALKTLNGAFLCYRALSLLIEILEVDFKLASFKFKAREKTFSPHLEKIKA